MIDHMTHGRITVEYLAGLPGGPLVRFAAGAGGVVVLRDAFARLAGGEQAVAVEGLEPPGLSSVEFRQGIRGGLHSLAPGRLVFDGDRGQWETRACLLDPLALSAGGFQYLDYDGSGELGAVVTTHPDGSF
jgi:hypothetical protein